MFSHFGGRENVSRGLATSDITINFYFILFYLFITDKGPELPEGH